MVLHWCYALSPPYIVSALDEPPIWVEKPKKPDMKEWWEAARWTLAGLADGRFVLKPAAAAALAAQEAVLTKDDGLG